MNIPFKDSRTAEILAAARARKGNQQTTIPTFSEKVIISLLLEKHIAFGAPWLLQDPEFRRTFDIFFCAFFPEYFAPERKAERDGLRGAFLRDIADLSKN